MNIKASGFQAIQAGTVVKLRCPSCRQRGTFEQLNINDANISSANEMVTVGIRRCPDPACFALVFFMYKQGQVVDSYPPETIDFDATNVPVAVQTVLEEAIKCHAQRCFIASAIMVRKTLEELCRDRGAAGPRFAVTWE